MGVFDFVKDAGEAIGVGKGKKEEAARAATAKAEAAAQKAKKEALAKRRAAAAAQKAKAATAAKVRAAEEKKKAAAAKEKAMEEEKAQKLAAHVTGLGLKAKNMTVLFDDGVATVRGIAADAATKERIVLAIGNTQGVSQVKDYLKVAPPKKSTSQVKLSAAQRKAATARRKAKASAQTMHTVKSGDTLSAISKKYLGDANRYMEIFKANQPMLKDPDMIQVGQVLRIPRK